MKKRKKPVPIEELIRKLAEDGHTVQIWHCGIWCVSFYPAVHAITTGRTLRAALESAIKETK